MDQVYVVRHKVLVEKQSERAVAQELGISRNTVKRYVAGEVEPGVRKVTVRATPVLDAVKPRLDQLLDEWSTRIAGKQRITAARIYRALRAEGFEVGETTVKECLREWKRQRQEVFVPLEYPPGDLAQVDFFEVIVDVDGRRRKAWLFVMRLMHSGRDFARLYSRQDQVCFLDGHVRAFAHFGAVPNRIAYDNLRPAVKKVLVGSERELAPRFAALASHYLFEPCFARPATGHDKGGVEARGRTIRLQDFVPIPEGEHLDAISCELLARLDQRLNEKRSESDSLIGDLFAQEKLKMLPHPDHAFRASAVQTVSVSRRALVKFQTAYYSVWSTWAHLEITAYVGASEIEFVGPYGVRVTHPRLSFGGKSIDYRHYVRELARKPQAVRQVAGTLIRDLGAPFDRVWRQLVDEQGPRQASRVFARVLGSIVELGHHEVVQRLDRALAADEPLVLALRSPPEPDPRLELHELPASLQSINIEGSAASDYDALLIGGGA